MSQHIGAPARPIVKKGDRVLAGQKLAEADGYMSVPVFSSVSGTVKAIEPRRVVTGDNVMSIVVENDRQYEEVEYPPVKPLEQLTREEKTESDQRGRRGRHGRRRLSHPCEAGSKGPGCD